MSTAKNKNTKLITIKKLWPLLWPTSLVGYKMRLLIAMIAMLLSKITLVMLPAMFKGIVDSLGAVNIPESESFFTKVIPTFFMNMGPFIPWIIGYGVLRLASPFFFELKDLQFAKITQRALRELGLLVFDHLHNLSLRFHIGKQTGGVARVIERGTKSLETLMMFLTFNIVPTAIEIILVGVVFIVMYDVSYMVVMLATMLAYIVFTLKLTEWRIGFVREMNTVDTAAQAKAIDSLMNYETVKYFGNEKHEHHRFNKGLITYEKTAVESRLSLAYLNLGQAVILTIGLVLVMGMAAMDVKRGILTVGDLVAINTFLIQLTIPLFNLGFAYREIKLALVNLEDMFTLLHEPYEIKDPVNAINLHDIKDSITFNNVFFHYNQDRAILKDVSFSIKKGHTVAVVGSSGAGKSTLARLLFRFYDVIDGSIQIDGMDCRSISQKSLRSLIGIVPQDTVLFNDTIYYNIAYGNPDATKDDIIEAAQKAEIYDFIKRLPEGFDTMVGERGLKLSGGEKQRVAIARTLLKKPAFFIFDEATSALDTKTEKLIQENLQRISRNKTTLIIAHRLSTVVHADTIIVMDGGRIIEQGNHSDLIAANGLYAQMWQRQQVEAEIADA